MQPIHFIYICLPTVTLSLNHSLNEAKVILILPDSLVQVCPHTQHSFIKREVWSYDWWSSTFHLHEEKTSSVVLGSDFIKNSFLFKLSLEFKVNTSDNNHMQNGDLVVEFEQENWNQWKVINRLVKTVKKNNVINMKCEKYDHNNQPQITWLK